MENVTVCPVVLAGGSGTRLWPMSREEYPKQLLALSGGNTLLQETVLRVDGLGAVAGEGTAVLPPVLVCNEEHRFLSFEQLEAVRHTPSRIVLEPVGRNTAPALTVAALSIAQMYGDPVMLVMPADHVIRDVDAFLSVVSNGAALAVDGFIVTFGIVPTRAETGYGYIRKGDSMEAPPAAFAIDAFVEKPKRDTAKSYFESGRYLWNSGLFMMRASVWLDAIDRHRRDVLDACRSAHEGGRADGAFYRVDATSFEACPSDSIDYAVMERLANSKLKPPSDGRDGEAIPAAVVAMDAGWSDVGSWPALAEIQDSDAAGNVVQGDVFLHDTKRSMVIAGRDRLVAAIGMTDTIVVDTADAVLVLDRKHAQSVPVAVRWLKAEGREEGRTHRKVYRPWGAYEQIDAGERYQVKRLTVKPGAQLSLQMHHHRAEHWVVVRGTAKVTKGTEEFLLTENESTYISLGETHRLENPGSVELEVIEVQSGSYLGEDDIVRFEDRYNR